MFETITTYLINSFPFAQSINTSTHNNRCNCKWAPQYFIFTKIELIIFSSVLFYRLEPMVTNQTLVPQAAMANLYVICLSPPEYLVYDYIILQHQDRPIIQSDL